MILGRVFKVTLEVQAKGIKTLIIGVFFFEGEATFCKLSYFQCAVNKQIETVLIVIIEFIVRYE